MEVFYFIQLKGLASSIVFLITSTERIFNSLQIQKNSYIVGTNHVPIIEMHGAKSAPYILITVSAKDLGGCHEGSPEIIPHEIQKECKKNVI
ncbi:MAG: hypothetical protein K0S01_2541 [Herbinix sp.]|nr:hypothetical protein [Herbinix sp.]